MHENVRRAAIWGAKGHGQLPFEGVKEDEPFSELRARQPVTKRTVRPTQHPPHLFFAPPLAFFQGVLHFCEVHNKETTRAAYDLSSHLEPAK